MTGEEVTDMEERNKSDLESYIFHINRICDMLSDKGCMGKNATIKECYGKLGLFASAEDVLIYIHNARVDLVNKGDIKRDVDDIALTALLVISLYTDTEPKEIVCAQIDLYKLKNKRYGNSFAECFAKDGYPYAFGHLQEKANRICSLLTLNDEAKEEPILDSYKDLLGYCILTLVEIRKAEFENDVQGI